MIRILLNPFVIFLIGILLSSLFLYLKKRNWVRATCLFSFIWLFICSFGFIPNLLLHNLENKFKSYKPSIKDTVAYHIIVLGGGHAEDPDLPPNGQLHVTALGRLIEGIRIHRLLPTSTLVLSGYSPSGKTTQAKILAETAILLGVEKGHILLQEEPKDTYEEARQYVNTYGNKHPLIVVTSASHMPRAIKMFKMFGISPIAAPTNFIIRKSNVEDNPWIPDVDNIKKMHTVIKEYVAIWSAKWRYQ